MAFSDDGGDGFATETSFGVGEDWLIGVSRNHAVAVDAGYVFGGEDQDHAGMSCDVVVQISKLKLRARMQAANHTQAKRGRGSLVCAADFRAVDFLLAVEPH